MNAALANGVAMPLLGLGTYKTPEGPVVERAVRTALDAGCRCIDTASFYGNEPGVGRALKAGGVPREDLFVITKVWNDEQGYDRALAALEGSLSRLQMEYIDLYLVHWPVKGLYTDTWKALQELYRRGLARAIGVSNFMVHHMEEVMKLGGVAPMVNQFELHPLLFQRDIVLFCEKNGIQVQSWAPLARGALFGDPVIQELSKKHGHTPAQVIIRWHLQHGFAAIPKSVDPRRIVENLGVFDFTLSGGDIERIDGLNRGERLGPHPDVFST